MPDVTRLLDAASAGDRQAAADLLPLVYNELRRLAAARMAAERSDHTLDATALVHEAYLRLVGNQQFDGRGHFFAAAAEAMRRILVDHARARTAGKRGGHRAREALDDVAAPEPQVDLLQLDEALTSLATVDAEAAELVQLRYFAGLSLPATAEAMQVSPRSADRIWAFAKAWLFRELSNSWRDLPADSA
jgi:RNA polymerase sigma factor (TIGR02999 family)